MMIACALAANISTTIANVFGYYLAVSVVGLSAADLQAGLHYRQRKIEFRVPRRSYGDR